MYLCEKERVRVCCERGWRRWRRGAPCLVTRRAESDSSVRTKGRQARASMLSDTREHVPKDAGDSRGCAREGAPMRVPTSDAGTTAVFSAVMVVPNAYWKGAHIQLKLRVRSWFQIQESKKEDQVFRSLKKQHNPIFLGEKRAKESSSWGGCGCGCGNSGGGGGGGGGCGGACGGVLVAVCLWRWCLRL